MKTTITIKIDTNNMSPLYDENDKVLETFMREVEENIHNSILMWLKDNLNDEAITNVIITNYYGLKLVENIEELGEYGNIKITYQDEGSLEPEILLNILSCNKIETPKKDMLSTVKKEEEIPDMELDDNDDDFSEFNEKIDDNEIVEDNNEISK